jgi:predicted nuclease of restriction endonuclease-like (RecB) superfamily
MKTPVKKYNQWLVELKKNIHQSRLKSALQVNSNMLVEYWYIGKQIIQKTDTEGWGAKIIETLAVDLQKEFPDAKGYSYRNLKYMKQFAGLYPELLIGQQPAAQLNKSGKSQIVQQPVAQLRNNKNIITQQSVALINQNEFGQQPVAQMKNTRGLIVQQPAPQLTKGKRKITQQPAALINENTFGQQPVAQFGNNIYILSNPSIVSIPWGRHVTLMDKINDNEERLWYINKTIENNWSRAVLQYQEETDLYQRQHKTKKTSNFHLTLPKPQADLANQILKDPYIFHFFELAENATEKDLEKQLIKHIQEFIMELGAGFTFVGRQVKFVPAKKEYFVDLLFYHLFLRCYVAIDLKMNEFEMEHSGKMNGYLNMVNKKLRHPSDSPSVGIILCGSKDNVEVDYALTGTNHPIGVSEYKFSKSLPKALKDKLPSAKQLQDEVKRFLKKINTAKRTKL